MTDTTAPAAPATPAPTAPVPVALTLSAVEAALASAASTAASNIEASAVAYIQSLEAKAKTELGVVESKLSALWTKVKGYAKPALVAAVIGGAGYVVAHFKLI